MSDHIVKHEQLKEVAVDLWTKAKKRDIEALTYDPNTKTLKGTNSSNADLSVSTTLTDLVSINDRAKFKQDVSVDKAGTANNLHIGEMDGDQSDNRILGYRGLTSKAFVDGYVSELIVYAKSTLDVGTQTNWNVWAIKKEERKEQDTVKAIFHKNNVEVESITINGQAEKCVRLSIDHEFTEEVYFLVKSQNQQVKTCIPTNTYKPDVVNMSESPRDTVGQTFSWSTNNTGNTAIIHLVGRESIASLAEKLRKTQSDGSNYVLKTDTTDTGGSNQYAGKVVKLSNDGTINPNMIPEIAINRVLSTANQASALTLIGDGKDRLQVGDVVVLQDTNKIYIYKGRPDGQTNNDFTRDFLEISMGNGAVKSVNTIPPGANGNVTVNADNIKLSSTDNTNVKAELDKKISTITLHNDKKHLTITKATGAAPEQLDLTTAFAADNISYSGQIGGVAKNNVKEAIDALKNEANKGIKSIKGGRPNTNGELDVTVNTAGTGIAMTFGDSNTPVQIATYMTDTEVNEIKTLFR